ncbi:hypothetical protein D3C80_1858250 [compost metagenome]
MGRAIARKKAIGIDPAGLHYAFFDQGQNDVTAAENEGAGSIEGVQQGDAVEACRHRGERQARQEQKEQDQSP